MANKNIQLQSANGVDNLFPLCKFERIWKNATYSSGSSGLALTKDLSNYAFVYIRFTNVGGWEISNNKVFGLLLPVGNTDADFSFGIYNNYFVWRNIKVNTGGITIGNGYYNSSATAGATSSNAMVPFDIIGIRGIYEDLTT